MRSILPLPVLLLAACAAGTQEVRVISDVAYRDGGEAYPSERCKLDLYIPPSGRNSKFPVMVWFHGGGLQRGEKTSRITVDVGQRFAGASILVARVNYRLSPKVEYPAYIEDAAAAIAWVVRNIGRHGGDPKKVFVSGHSAGGYLAAMVSVDGRYLEKQGLGLDVIAGALPVSGQMDTHTTVRKERELDPKGQVIDGAAPLRYVGRDLPPMLVIVGNKDLPGREEINRRFHAALEKADHPDASLLVGEGRTHGTIISRCAEKDDEISASMVAFIRRLSRP